MGIKTQICTLYAFFKVNTKKFQKNKKGKYARKWFLLSFLTGRSNKFNFFTRFLHFYCFLHRHPYKLTWWPYLKMATWSFGHILAIWPYDYMALMTGYMGVSGKSITNAAIRWRNWIDWTFLWGMRAKSIHGIFYCTPISVVLHISYSCVKISLYTKHQFPWLSEGSIIS